jgi:replication factor C subunit 2/4
MEQKLFKNRHKKYKIDKENKLKNDDRYKQIPWTEKYRPTDINDIYLPMVIKNRMIDIINSKDMPNIILTGPPGIGKTSAIKIIASELYGKYYDETVIELNLLDERGIKFMQGGIIPFCKTKIPYQQKDENRYPSYKLIIFDEADNITPRVQDQITNIMEKFGNRIRFAFTCNSSEGIVESIQTKCLPWRYSSLSIKNITDKMIEICDNEKIKYTESSLKKIAEISQGDLRSAINKLHLLYNKYGEIKDDYIGELCNTPQEMIIKKLFLSIINKNLNEALKITFDLKNKSYSGSDISLGMLTTIKSSICDDIDQNIRINLSDNISFGIYRISNITDSDIQLAGCIVDMIDCIN